MPAATTRRPFCALLASAGLAAAGQAGCDRAVPGRARRSTRRPGALSLVFKHQPLWGDPRPFRALIEAFERRYPGVEVTSELLPNATDVLHQYFLTTLEGAVPDFDVLVVDVVWVQEFARAGWIADVSDAFPPGAITRDLLPGPAEAVLVANRTYAVPWWIDVGLLYYRRDLLPEPPRTYEDLARASHDLIRAGRVRHGYVWQGRQYEGLVCNALEAIWGHGGVTRAPRDRVRIDSPEAREAMRYLRGLIERGTSPALVTSSAEEECRRAFQDGSAAFMRNWPYAYREANAPRSPVRGRVGFAPLPTLRGEPGYGALGGWQLAINAHCPPAQRQAARALIAHLTSPEAQLEMARAYGRIPPRRALYQDPRLRAAQPFLADLAPIVERARPRPVTAYYNMLTDALQGELSAAVVGVRSPERALARAQALIDHVTGARS